MKLSKTSQRPLRYDRLGTKLKNVNLSSPLSRSVRRLTRYPGVLNIVQRSFFLSSLYQSALVPIPGCSRAKRGNRGRRKIRCETLAASHVDNTVQIRLS